MCDKEKNPKYVNNANDKSKLLPDLGIIRMFLSYHFNDFADSDDLDCRKYEK